jgi:hypothetical protein
MSGKEKKRPVDALLRSWCLSRTSNRVESYEWDSGRHQMRPRSCNAAQRESRMNAPIGSCLGLGSRHATVSQIIKIYLPQQSFCGFFCSRYYDKKNSQILTDRTRKICPRCKNWRYGFSRSAQLCFSCHCDYPPSNPSFLY